MYGVQAVRPIISKSTYSTIQAGLQRTDTAGSAAIHCKRKMSRNEIVHCFEWLLATFIENQCAFTISSFQTMSSDT